MLQSPTSCGGLFFKEVRCLLQLPINVYPSNGVTLDKTFTSEANDTNVRFTFKGDILRACIIRFYDYETRSVVVNDTPIYDYDSENYVFRNIAYNNDEMIYGGLLSALSVTGSYVMRMLLVEGTIQTSGVETNHFVLRGTINEDCEAGSTTIKIEDKINSIFEWSLDPTGIKTPVTVTENGRTYELGSMNIIVNGEQKRISSYDYNTGELTLATGLTEAVTKGTAYQIYSNYLMTEDYYFNTASMPVITNLYATFDAYGIHFTGNCNDIISYYNVIMQKKSDSNVYYDIAETERIYSQRIKYDFCDDYDYMGLGGNDETQIYRFIVKACARNGMYISATSNDIIAPNRENTNILNSTSLTVTKGWNSIFIQWEKNQSHETEPWGYRIYRINSKENYGSFPYKQLVYDISGSYGGFEDYTASTHGSYKYMIVPYYYGSASSTRIAKAVLTDEITTSLYGYTITAITDTNKDADDKPFYVIGDTWKFVADIENTAVTQNMDNVLHVGYGKYSSKTSTNVNYASGSLSAYIGQVSCVNGIDCRDDIELVKKWREFITQDCLFIIRSQKGDVWVVNVVDNPSTEYQEDDSQLSTKISFSWAECCKIEDILIGEYLPPKYKDRD